MRKTEFAMKESTFSVCLSLRMLASAVVSLVVISSIFMACHVPSGSMLPTFNIGEVVLALRTNSQSTINRADIVIFKPFTAENNYLNRAESDRGDLYVKRVIGLPGDTIEISNSSLYINGELYNESYLPGALAMADFEQVTVPDDCYFMMGDNRNASEDSRIIGFIPKENVISKSIFHTNSIVGRVLKLTST